MSSHIDRWLIGRPRSLLALPGAIKLFGRRFCLRYQIHKYLMAHVYELPGKRMSNFIRMRLDIHELFLHVSEICRHRGFPREAGLSLAELINTTDSGTLLKLPTRNAPLLSLWSEGNVDELTLLASRLIKDMPNTRFVGVGHSPSYLVYGIDCVSSCQRAEQIPTEYIPFSSQFLTLRSDRRSPVLIYDAHSSSNHYATTYFMAKTYAPYYQTFLSGRGLHPADIVRRFTHSGEQMAIVDNIQTGASFASFICFMHSWAQSEGIKRDVFARALCCVGLVTDEVGEPSLITIPDKQIDAALTPVHISRGLQLAINGNVSEGQDRFIPAYPPEDWGRPPPAMPKQDQDIVSVVQEMIRERTRERPLQDLRAPVHAVPL